MNEIACKECDYFEKKINENDDEGEENDTEATTMIIIILKKTKII